jgi:hypothetical protein
MPQDARKGSPKAASENKPKEKVLYATRGRPWGHIASAKTAKS